jgi:O-antigen/teichoic acid export membrane protein
LSIARLGSIAPDLMTGWKRPSYAEARLLLTNGTGVWLGALGWQLLSATNAIVITYLRHPEWVPIYNCTAKLSQMLTQLVWVPADSALVALAQLFGERKGVDRLRHVVLMMLRLHLLLSGAAACLLLAFNPAFVIRWVGAPFFGGVGLNALLAAGVLLYSLVHGFITTASVLGNRMKVGVVGLVNGVAQTIVAVLFGHWWGLPGIAVAGLVAASVTSVPAGIFLLRPETGLSVRHLIRELLMPWAMRAVALLAAAAACGFFYQTLGLVSSASFAAVISLAYLWQMRPLYLGLPLDRRWTEWLVRVKLLPAARIAPLAAMDQA